jgi:hypothetical protein
MVLFMAGRDREAADYSERMAATAEWLAAISELTLEVVTKARSPWTRAPVRQRVRRSFFMREEIGVVRA